ncbi:MAG: diguanylate cyclase [Rhodocyclaceae bacterium]|nr:diguanylate cyclase [Rhodocyclaceae bacterium]
MNLRPRIHILTGLLVIISAVASWGALYKLAEQIVAEWGVRYAEKQVLYDKLRTLQPIQREIELSRQFANSGVVRAWARSPDNPALAKLAVGEMERFRLRFADQAYFLAFAKSGHYYYNNAANEFAGRQLRYTLDRKKPTDQWFYDLIRQDRGIHLNVNRDGHLGVTKVWIDVLVRDGDRIVGVAGTGLDLSGFIRDVVDSPQPGITSLFVDRHGSIQVHRDQSLIDFASLTKAAGEHNDIKLLVSDKSDQEAIYAAMKELETETSRVASRFVNIKGKRYLAGIGYLPEIGWYEITLLDLDVLLPLSSFTGMVLVFGLTLLAALVMFNLVLSRLILNPLKQLELAMITLRQGQPVPDSMPSGGKDEIGRLMRHFRDMAHAVWASRAELEAKVRERTEALEHLSKTDSLTRLLNRRGMTERIEAEISRSERESIGFGILWLDVDYFKEINDKHGHAVGDQALMNVANQILAIIRPYDRAARWGGDEFLVLVQGCDETVLMSLGERIRKAVAGGGSLGGGSVRLSVSIGGTLSAGETQIETILQNADYALYAAKEAGRNCLRFYSVEGLMPGISG